MKNETRTGIIAFQGEPGANSDTACRNVYPAMEPLPCATFEDAFDALATGKAELAMIPIENTLAGRVADIHHLLPESGFHIIAEYFLPIDFHLMALPGVAFEDIETVYTHIHGLGQCRKIIRENGWTGEVAGDTAGAARMIRDNGDKKAAALAPLLAAELYGINVLREFVQDADHNTTRFVVLSREPEVPEFEAGPAVTSFVFQVKNVPAALYKVLGGFATNSINMTKLESYQIEGTFTATLFYADIEGHPEQENVARALEEMDFFCKRKTLLGTYPADARRMDND
ncbi:prephenate dehydratase [Ahrensia sp. R2A130]|uniref:prephenate dehydratase n=1 Tax=Ahrensia sp. R2A130 TaxID=744979 RepID=UPI0001E0E085|nr:prephenate dehydratase [Ahrensia sp. R2A130]EFL89827.1 P-protein [Ahrensia sp. R2A130]